MIGIEHIVYSRIKRKGIEGDQKAKRNLCMKILRHYENQSGKKDKYLGAKLYKAHKLVSKFSS